MRKELNPAATVAILAVVIIVLGVIAWRIFGPEPPPRATPEVRAAAERMAEGFKEAAKAMQQRQRAMVGPTPKLAEPQGQAPEKK
jgi:hypothetical protein